MMISVIIPVYNVEQYLAGCLDSVLKNDTENSEILLIDDGATDRSGAICDEYAERYPNLIRVIHQENGGLGAARNTGIEAAKGEWLLFVDSDDKILPQTLSKLRAACDPALDVIGFQFFADNGVDMPIPKSCGFASSAEQFTLKERKDYLLSLPSAWLRLWRKSLFTETGIRYPSKVWYEDIRTTVKLLALARGIIVLPDQLYRYLQRPGSIMSNQNLTRNREIIEAFDDILSWYRENGLLDQYKTELTALTAEHVLLAASVRVARIDPNHPLLPALRAYTDKAFPDWASNPYLRRLSKPKALALRLIRGGHYKVLSRLFRLKG